MRMRSCSARPSRASPDSIMSTANGPNTGKIISMLEASPAMMRYAGRSGTTTASSPGTGRISFARRAIRRARAVSPGSDPSSTHGSSAPFATRPSSSACGSSKGDRSQEHGISELPHERHSPGFHENQKGTNRFFRPLCTNGSACERVSAVARPIPKELRSFSIRPLMYCAARRYRL